jgi:phage tail sheath protein FI
MPEYLSPGVYVEEIELGPKPIEGVSTSTAGMVGVTERGPSDVPVLVTSFPEFQRLFGGYLDPRDFPNTNPNNLSFLPHAVEGFFQNGGQRVYVVRVISQNAAEAGTTLMTQENPTAYASTLIGRASEGDEFLIVGSSFGLAGGETLRIDDGAVTEYLDLAAGAFPALTDRLVALRAPAYGSYARQAPVNQLPAFAVAAAPGDFPVTLAGAASAGSNRIRLSTLAPAGKNALVAGDILQLTDTPDIGQNEIVVVDAVPTAPGDTTITLRQRLAYGHAAGTGIDRVAEGAGPVARVLAQGVGSGAGLLLMTATTNFLPDTVVRIGGPPSTAPASYHFVAPFRAIALERPTYQAHAAAEPVTVLTLTDVAGPTHATPLAADVAAGATTIRVVDRSVFTTVGEWIHILGADDESNQVAALPVTPADEVVLHQPLRNAHSAGASVRQQTVATGARTTLLQSVPVDGPLLLLANNTAGAFDPTTTVQIGDAAATNWEFQILGAVQTPALLPLATPPAPAPPSRVTSGHDPATPVQLRAALFTARALDDGAWGNELRVIVEEEDPPAVQTTAAPAAPNSDVTLASTSGVEPGTLLELLDVSTQLTVAADRGDTEVDVPGGTGLAAGDRVRIGRAVPDYAQITIVTALPTGGDRLTLSDPLRHDQGVGSWLDRMDASGLPRLAKVQQRVGTNRARFDGAGLPFAITGAWTVRSREFKLTVQWVKRGRANVRTPGEERILDSETHRYLTLDDRHSRYIGKIIGSTTNPRRIWDRRPEGQSDYIRVEDPLTSQQTQDQIRPGPDLIYEVLPTGRRRSVGRPLIGGTDDTGGITDAVYQGVDNIDPLLRTGLFSLKNEEEISLVALPGRVSQFIQDALINHCELMRYRFAVLDSEPGADPNEGAALPEVQFQRQQFDSKYAALYYPWLRLRNPYPGNPALPGDVSIPPGGHVLGIYARSDVTRGVHKAPANEVIAGIRGLQRKLTKGEHDILNPSPVNINVLRDFREQFRGNRVWGARVITSDAEWKYVNVRRLFIYIERSLELGLQWVVFEPNDYDLWARVRRSISDFLTAVWRSGGLMGKTAEEAYFVRCDRTTMTQADIDNGRLIVVIGIAPVKPAEFVIIRIGQWQGGSSIEEGLA